MDKQIANEIKNAGNQPIKDKLSTFAILAAKDTALSVPKVLKEDFGTKAGLERTAAMAVSTAGLGALLEYAPAPVKAVAGVGMLGVFGYEALKPLVESAIDGSKAKNLNDLKAAANNFGSAITSTAVSFGIGGGAWKLGSMAAEDAISGEAAVAAKNSIDMNSKLAMHDIRSSFLKPSDVNASNDALAALEKASKTSLLDTNLSDSLKTLEGSARKTLKGDVVGDVKEEEPTSATIFLKTTKPTNEAKLIDDIMSGRRKPLSNEEYRKLYKVSTADVAKFRDYAKEHNLSVDVSHAQDGYVKVNGKAIDMQKAFNTKLVQVKHVDTGNLFTAQVEDVKLPHDIANIVDNVTGMDQHPIAKSQIRMLNPIGSDPQAALADAQDHGLTAEITDSGKPGAGGQPRRPSGYNGADVAKAANTPDGNMGAGRKAVVLELGGAVNKKADFKFFTENGLKEAPSITSKAIDGAQIASDGPNGADGEVALDYQNIGMAAPNATQEVVFAPNNDQGMPDVLLYAANEAKVKPDVVSISWGSPESNWTSSAVQAMDAAAKQAVLKGINIFAASGDNGSGDGVGDGQAHADYPASSRYITGTGGLRQVIKGGKTVSESVWNDGSQGGAGGGAPSSLFQTPDYQAGVANNIVDVNGNPTNTRGVPDVSGNADPQTGFKVKVDGQDAIIGGTSAEAPMYSARWMRILNAYKEQTGHELTGDYKDLLYKAYADNPNVVRDITQGNNDENGDIGGFNAGPGYDLASGLGDVKDDVFLDWLVKNHPNANKTIGAHMINLANNFIGDENLSTIDKLSLNSQNLAVNPLFGGALAASINNMVSDKNQ